MLTLRLTVRVAGGEMLYSNNTINNIKMTITQVLYHYLGYWLDLGGGGLMEYCNTQNTQLIFTTVWSVYWDSLVQLNCFRLKVFKCERE